MRRSASDPRAGASERRTAHRLRDHVRAYFAFRPLPTWLSLTLVAVFSIGLIDALRLAFAGPVVDGAQIPQLLIQTGRLLGFLVAYLAILRTPVASLVSVPLLLLLLVSGDSFPALVGGGVLVLFAPVTSGWACTVTSWSMYLAWTVAASALRGPDWAGVFWPTTVVFVAAAVMGTAARGFQHELSRCRRELEELARENASIREDERAALARELHDVVAHELSLISLQITSRGRTDDPAELHRVLDSVRRSTHAALLELRLLIGLLREDDVAEDADLGHLKEDTSVVHVVESLDRRLTELGYDVRFSAPAEVDQLPFTVGRTVIRILQESCTNITKHAPARCECRAEVRLDDRYITLTVSNPLGTGERHEDLQHGPTGWGLRGIAERVDLLGGDLSAGPQGHDWVVSARIPLSADERS